MHYYWMEHVMQHCDSSIEGGKRQGHGHGRGPCYNVIHPWESMVEMGSPQWNDFLHYVMQIIKEKDWAPPPEMIPDYVRYSIHYPENESVYHAMLYLTECHANVTILGDNDTPPDDTGMKMKTRTGSGSGSGSGSANYEMQLMKNCPFAMLDVSHLSVLARSNHDLDQMGKILHESHSKKAPTTTQWGMIKGWIDLTDGLMEQQLFESESSGAGRYVSRSLIFAKNDTIVGNVTTSTFDYNGSVSMESHSSGNLMAGWNILNTSRFMSSVVDPLLNRDGDFTFNCGAYPIWSWACSSNAGTRNTVNSASAAAAAQSSIHPLMNYWISIGLLRNGAAGVGKFVQQSTLQLMCLQPDDDDALNNLSPESYSSCDNLTFASIYNAQSGVPFPNSTQCDMTSTTSAALAYNLLIQDAPFSYKPAPPMQNGWVIVLILAEIMIAFSVGLSCFLLSLNLLRRLKNDADEDALLQLAREENEHENENEERRDDLQLGDGDNGDSSRQEYFRLIGGEDVDGDPFPVLVWKFVQHVNPFQSTRTGTGTHHEDI